MSDWLMRAFFIVVLGTAIDLLSLAHKATNHLGRIEEALEEIKSDISSLEFEVSSVRKNKEFRATAGFEFE